jgi:hypothetical protein
MDFSSCEDDDTPRHTAIREALANALIHADYYDRCGIVAICYADRVEIRNPGSIGTVTLLSNDPSLPVEEVMREFALESYTDYLARSRRTRGEALAR